MKVFYRKTVEEAVEPKRANAHDAGFDLVSIQDCDIPAGTSTLVDTGLQIEMFDEGVQNQSDFNYSNLCAMVCSRSGLAAKNNVFVLNAPGIIDEGYRGNIKVILYNAGSQVYNVKKGDKVAQLLFLDVHSPQFIFKQRLEESDRGAGGFGSSGK